MATAPGYAEISIEILHSSLVRSAFLTFGVDPVDTDPALVAASVISASLTSGTLLGCIDTSATVRSVRVSLGTDGAEDLVHVTPLTTLGLKSGQMVPPNVSVLVHKRTARGGRRGRGRLYLPWAVAIANVDEGGTITTAEVTAIQTKMTAWKDALITNQVPMVVLHDPGLSAVGPPNQVTSLTVDPRVGTQRRRLGR